MDTLWSIVCTVTWSSACCNGVKHNVAFGWMIFFRSLIIPYFILKNLLSCFLSFDIAAYIKCLISWFPFPTAHQKHLSSFVKMHMPRPDPRHPESEFQCRVEWEVWEYSSKNAIRRHRHRVVNHSSCVTYWQQGTIGPRFGLGVI